MTKNIPLISWLETKIWQSHVKGFVPYGGEKDLTEDKLKSCLECLAQVIWNNWKLMVFIPIINSKWSCFYLPVARDWDGFQTSPRRSGRGGFLYHLLLATAAFNHIQVLALFPKMSEQAQLQDILEKRETRKCIRSLKMSTTCSFKSIIDSRDPDQISPLFYFIFSTWSHVIEDTTMWL